MTLHRRLALPLAVLGALALAGAAGEPAPQTLPAAAATPVEDRLVLALLRPERIASVDLSSGEATTLRLPGGTLCRSQLLAIDGRIVYLAPGRHGSRVMSIDLALRERPHWLARADAVVPSSVPGHVWIASRAPGPHGHWLVQDLAVRGGAISRPPRRAPSLPIIGAVTEGLVLQGRHETFVWDPRTGRRSRPTPGAWLLATQGSLLASCGGHCRTLLLADGRRGRVVHAPEGGSFLPTGAALSPAGDLLAVPLAPWRRPRVALVETATGRRRILAGARIRLPAALAFSPDGERLYAAEPSGRVHAFTAGGHAAGTVGPRFAAPIVQLLAARAAPEPPRLPRFAWLPAGWRQDSDAPAYPGAPAQGAILATSWRYHPAPHGPAGALPAGGVIVSVRLLPRPSGAAPVETLPRLVLPARPDGELEGRPGVPEYRIVETCGTRRLEVRVDVAAQRLDPARRAQVQRMLDALLLPPPPGGCRTTL